MHNPTGPHAPSPAAAARAGKTGSPGAQPEDILQPHSGDIPGDHYLVSTPDEVLWGYVPTVHAAPVARMKSGETITIDALSHEGILEDQGRDPVSFFGSHGVEESGVLQDAVDIAAGYNRTPRNFDTDGPHVVTGPVAVEGAEPGDVLKIETLDAVPRVPYGVVSSRHGKGSLAVQPGPEAPAGITLEEVMPPVDTDNRGSGVPTDYHNVSVFTAVEDGKGVMTSGEMKVRFPLRPFMGMMGVAFAETSGLTDPEANSVPPTLGGGNIDIRHLGPGSTFYLPVKADGALFYVGDPHMGMGDGEVALTAMEGSLRGTFRLTVCKPGSGDAPELAHRYPFAETADAWIPIGLSDPDGLGGGGVNSDLDIAMRRAVVNALDFLEQEKGMDRAVAYAYLSAAADFAISQVVDRTVGIHGLIRKADFS
ncbi:MULTISPECIES: acetamidase/formamidase family protein [unclassified Arthrobacter]|uniref:acetamidase/formamidase family protein n=1 Tax=unclassified Arthrobacter TaxID=235627 RepID=UPI0024DF8A1E|nr:MULTISPECIES: acetamidase/formamidase family protein [unclassified Arthrobacter]MCC9146816.1 acetamidase/formamidase family protein [Arthrobacter sp. zg-Y919]MDK1278047.1 acetamidase/formamidase family protein [Arthrobacter sp. zg.Y919]WIB03364.1 acetamidase/formamidase family protein [Arthrobacter sp. zg-Y919]